MRDQPIQTFQRFRIKAKKNFNFNFTGSKNKFTLQTGSADACSKNKKNDCFRSSKKVLSKF